MAIGAARVMAAGKAGLESLPFFVDELMAQGIPQLAPWALDHSQDQIDQLKAMTQERVAGNWRSLFDIGISSPGISMGADVAANRRLLQLENPLAAEAIELADYPAQLGVWCRRQMGAICRDALVCVVIFTIIRLAPESRGCGHISLAQMAKARIWHIARYAAAVFA